MDGSSYSTVKKLGNFYRFVNVLSLDVAAGAIVSAIFFAQLLKVPIPPWAISSLGLTVWIIYTTDHLVDAKSIQGPASTRRHRFHQHHFNVLAAFVVIAMLVDGLLILFMRKQVLQSGLVLFGAVIVYFLVQRNLRYAKEFCGALLYSAGVLLPAWSLSPGFTELSQGMVAAEFCIIVLCNLLLFSLFDHDRDLRDHHHSFVTAMGDKKARILLAFLFALNGLLILTQFIWLVDRRGILWIVLFMNLVLLALFVFHERFRVNDNYRLLGDLVFFAPLLLLL